MFSGTGDTVWNVTFVPLSVSVATTPFTEIVAPVKAGDATPLQDWWLAGDAPLLVVEAAKDVVVARANTQAIKAEGGKRVTVASIADAGHALLPEKPEEVARTIIDYLLA